MCVKYAGDSKSITPLRAWIDARALTNPGNCGDLYKFTACCLGRASQQSLRVGLLALLSSEVIDQLNDCATAVAHAFLYRRA